MTTQDQLRQLPSVDALLQNHIVSALAQRYSHTLVVEAARAALDAARQKVLAGDGAPMPALLIDDVRERVERAAQPSLVPVINATGVIIHTNLGRAPLSEETIAAMKSAAQGYTNLEYDLAAGERGSRHVHAGRLAGRRTVVARIWA